MIDIKTLAERAGIQSSYTDIWGNEHPLSEDSARHLLKALGLAAECDNDIRNVEQELNEDAHYPCVRVLDEHRQCVLPVLGAVSWQLSDEKAQMKQGKVIRDTILIPPLEAGYYDLRIQRQGGDFSSSFLIVAPKKCWLPDAMKAGKRIWGLSAQLYSLVSDENWGMGDCGDLASLVKFAAQQKADIVGLNPLHALFPSDPNHYAPYSPSNRMFLNTLYLNVPAINGFTECAEAKKIWDDASFQKKLSDARESKFIDYPLVAKIKYEILEPLYIFFLTKERPTSFENFCKERGEALAQQAAFDALSEHFAVQKGAAQSWRDWPEAYRNPASPEVKKFVAEQAERVGFYAWLQWLIDQQLANAQAIALQQGMMIGLYRDLAVGSEVAGAEIWSDTSAYLANISVGAPPDEYNPSGQNWGLLAFNPHQLRRRHYEPYIRLLRDNMRHCRALRIDHAFGLARFFLIPAGKSPADGAYLNFPFNEMLAVLRLESHRNQCVIIGEDLGTFPPNYKIAAAQAGLLSYKVLYFERNQDGRFKQPNHYEPLALATLSTHDLPTLAGWLQSEDIREKEKLHIYPSNDLLRRDRETRERDVPFLEKTLVENVADPETSLLEKAELYLAKSPAAIVMVQLEDTLGVVPQANLPATTTERPNWRMKLPKTLDEIYADQAFRKLAAALTAERQKSIVDYPRCTYRLQFHKEFTFADAAAIVPYLARLGISHVYCSPYVQARPGSMHGYDITDHNKLNPELGGEKGYEEFCRSLQTHGLKQILDFVPNHMGIGGADNGWWLDVLEWGWRSPYAGYFDINWEPRYRGDAPKILLPFLNDHYGDVLNRGELILAFDAEEGSFSVWYFTHRFGICPRDYAQILSSLLPVETYQEGQTCKAALAKDKARHAEIAQITDTINRDKEKLHALLESQNYRLAFWRVASSDINFRRFFDINDLAGMRTTEDENLFNAMHRLVFSLIESGTMSGLRIDHIDGLGDPAAYCRVVKQKSGASLYLIVEKILASHESLPSDWLVEGTSGYDALNLISDVFVATRAEKIIDRIYRSFTGAGQVWEQMAYDAKILILQTTLSSELQTLTLLLKRITEESRYTRDYPFDTLKQALKEIIGHFPVYRTYVTADDVSEDAARTIEWAVSKAKKHGRLVDISVYDCIASLLTLQELPTSAAILRFVRKFQQLTGPVMAKGIEDTAFYRFNRLISLNEVGASKHFGLTVKSFHQANKMRLHHFPHSMLATATHDTKHGEDMRMRLHILSERPLLWRKTLLRWRQINRACQSVAEDMVSPSPNDEYLIYQSLLGSWPLELMTIPLDAGALDAYRQRMEAYLVKAMREAKTSSSWNSPDEAYEKGVVDFLRQILDPQRHTAFLEEFVPLVRCMAALGVINSLGQTILKLTLPGVPDIYQGCEGWDFSLVDPDNRRPVDYTLRKNFLDQDGETLAQLVAHWQDGRVKQRLIHILLQHRKAYPDLYSFGDYEPLEASGKRASHLLAFSRCYGDQKLIVAIPILAAGQAKNSVISTDLYNDIALPCPAGHYVNIFNENFIDSGQDIMPCAGDFPWIVLATRT